MALVPLFHLSGCNLFSEDDKIGALNKKKRPADTADFVASNSDDTLTGNDKHSANVDEFDGGIETIQVYAEMFDALSSEAKQQLYNRFRRRYTHPFCASAHQKYCQVSHILEQILLHPGGVSVDIRSKIKQYLKYLWLYGGNQHPDTGERIRPMFIPGELGAATQIALRNGADIDLSSVKNVALDANNIEQLEALLSDIRPYIFGDAGEGDSGDKNDLDTSKNTSADTPPGNGSNSNTDTTEVPSARPTVANENGADMLYFTDVNFAGILAKLDNLATYCDQKVREVGGTKSTAAMRPGIPFAVGYILDLPASRSPLVPVDSEALGLGIASMTADPVDDRTTRVLWLNIDEAFELAIGRRVSEAFSTSASDLKKRRERRHLVSVAYHALRNLVGYGADGTENKAEDWLSQRLGNNNTLFEELRADLAVLYLAFDVAVQHTGLIPDEATRNALLSEYLMSTVEQIGAGGNIDTNVGLKTRLIVLNFLIQSGAVAAKAVQPGEYEISVSDYNAIRTPVIQLLGRVRNIRFFGDNVKATQLVTDFGYIAPGWRDGMVRRFKALQLPQSAALILPIIEKHKASAGNKSAVYSIRTPKGFFARNIELAAFAVH